MNRLPSSGEKVVSNPANSSSRKSGLSVLEVGRGNSLLEVVVVVVVVGRLVVVVVVVGVVIIVEEVGSLKPQHVRDCMQRL